jgi:hypothetical protein
MIEAAKAIGASAINWTTGVDNAILATATTRRMIRKAGARSRRVIRTRTSAVR